MAAEKTEKKELVSIGMVIIHPDRNEYVTFSKRISHGKDENGKTVKTMNKVEFKAGIPVDDGEAQTMYGCDLKKLVCLGIVEKSHTLNKVDTLLADFRQDEVPTDLVEMAALDFLSKGRAPGEKAAAIAAAAEKKAKDAMLKQYGFESQEEMDEAIAFAKAKKNRK